MTPLTNAEKQRRRREALDEIAAEAGYESHYKLMTAIVNGEVLVMEVSKMFQLGDVVRVKPFDSERHLVKGAVVNPPKARRHNGYRKATVTGFSDGGQVEVEVNGAYDYVPARALKLIERVEENEMTIEVIYSISTNENDYTDDEAYHEYVPALVDRIENEVTAYMKREYPHVEFDTRRVPETESYSNRSYPYSADEPGYEIIEELDNFVGNNWPDWFNEAAGAAEEQA